jgi:hypothetical protein
MLAVEPNPHEQGIATRDPLWDLEVEGLGLRRPVDPSMWAVASEGRCDFPCDTTVNRETYLTAAAVMGRAGCFGRVGKVGELEVSLLAGCPDYLWLFLLESVQMAPARPWIGQRRGAILVTASKRKVEKWVGLDSECVRFLRATERGRMPERPQNHQPFNAWIRIVRFRTL